MRLSEKAILASVFVVAVLAGLDYLGRVDTERAIADARADTASMRLAALATQSHKDEARFLEINAIAERKATFAEAANKDLRQYLASRAPAVTADTQSTGDTTAMVRIAPPDRPGQSWRIPQFLVDDVNGIIRNARALSEGFDASERARLFAVDTLVPDYKRQLYGADSVITALRYSIKVRDQSSHPKCGRRCGMALGTLTTLAALLLVHATVSR